MKIVNIEKRDVHVEIDFTIQDLMYLKFLLDNVPKIDYDPAEGEEKVEFMNGVDDFYERITQILKQMEKDFSQG